MTDQTRAYLVELERYWAAAERGENDGSVKNQDYVPQRARSGAIEVVHYSRHRPLWKQQSTAREILIQKRTAATTRRPVGQRC